MRVAGVHVRGRGVGVAWAWRAAAAHGAGGQHWQHAAELARRADALLLAVAPHAPHALQLRALLLVHTN